MAGSFWNSRSFLERSRAVGYRQSRLSLAVRGSIMTSWVYRGIEEKCKAGKEGCVNALIDKVECG